MSNYRRLISYIYAYEGEVKGKNIGFAKLETRNNQCKINVSVKKVYVGSNDLQVYLLSAAGEIALGKIFIRGGAGEFRTNLDLSSPENEAISMDKCYGLTIHDPENKWQNYTTIWEDAVAHAAEVELADVTAENARKKEAEQLEKNTGQKTALQENIQKEVVTPFAAAKPREWVSQLVDEEARQREKAFGERMEKIQPWERMAASFKAAAQPEVPAAPAQTAQPEIPASPAPTLQPGIPAGPAPTLNPDIPASPFSTAQPEIPAGPSPTLPPEIPARPAPTSQPEIPVRPHPGPEAQPAPEIPESPAPTSQPEVPAHSQPEIPARPQPEVPARPRPDSQPAPLPPEVPLPDEPQMDPEQLDKNEGELDYEAIWEKFSRTYPKIMAFDYKNGCEILRISPQDIGLLPRENWAYGNNSFLLHGYYSYRYLILVRLHNPNGRPRFLLGVPGHYYSNEKNMASMFGFPHFVLSKKQPIEQGRFGYWYTDVKIGAD